MRTKRTSLFKSAAFIVALSFLLGVSSAGAADREDKQVTKQITTTSKRPGPVGAGKYKGLEHFLKTLDSSSCTSNCCWAEANCAGGVTDCSETRCTASCPDGSRAGYTCPAT